MDTTETDSYNMGYEDGLGDAETRLDNATKKLEEAVATVQGSGYKASGPSASLNANDKKAYNIVQVANFVLAIPYSIYMAFVVSELWGWFVMPNWTNAPNPSLISWMGIALIVPLFTLGLAFTSAQLNRSPREKLEYEVAKLLGYPVVYSLTLLVGFIYSLFM